MSNFFSAATAKTNTAKSANTNETIPLLLLSFVAAFENPQKYSAEVNIIYTLTYKSDTRMFLRELKCCTQSNTQQNCNLEMVLASGLVTLDSSSRMLQSGLRIKVQVHNSSKALNSINLQLPVKHVSTLHSVYKI